MSPVLGIDLALLAAAGIAFGGYRATRGALLDRYSGCLDTSGTLRERVEGLRREWR